MAYRNTILAETALVAYWELEETSGTAAADSKSTHAGTYSGTYSLAQQGIWTNTATRGNALGLTGSGYVTVPAFAVASGGAISVEAWVYPTASGQNGSVIWKNPVNAQWGLFIEGGVIKWRGNSTSTLNGPTLTLNAWTHVVATQTGTTAILYVNGAQYATGTITAITDGTTGGTNDIDIGRFNSNYYLQGRLDEVALYNAVLTSTQVAAHYNAEAGYAVTALRVTQTGAEVLAVPSGTSLGALRATQVGAEVLAVPSGASIGNLRATQVGAEVLAVPNGASAGSLRATQVGAEVLWVPVYATPRSHVVVSG